MTVEDQGSRLAGADPEGAGVEPVRDGSRIAPEDPETFWEQRYAGAGPAAIWSGKVNASLAEIVGELPPGRSLDLGCGEGGDVLWLAQRGWVATGIDLSRTAIARAQARAEELGLDAAARFVAADLALWVVQGAQIDRSEEPFDLITASFLQSPVELPRERILRAALGRLAPGGRLVLIAHASQPPWVRHEQAGEAMGAPAHDHRDSGPRFITPEDELATLGELSPHEFTVLTAELRRREVRDPQGDPAHLDDSVVVVQRAG